MPSVNYALIYCTACGERRKIQPEKAYEQHRLGDLVWSRLRALECPLCKGRMAIMPEYGEPLWGVQGLWPMGSDVEWMA